MGQVLSFFILVSLIVFLACTLVIGGWFGIEKSIEGAGLLFSWFFEVLTEFWWIPAIAIAVPVCWCCLLEGIDTHRSEQRELQARSEYRRLERAELQRLRSHRQELRQELTRLRAVAR